MGIKSFLAKPIAALAVKQIEKWKKNPLEAQKKVFTHLISKAQNTAFGKDHSFSEIKNYQDFKKNVPLADYEELRTYIDR
ncbi:GH3 auxin-responsive promoter family protein, partial [Daejeonella sp.]|uniref:GH3 family domain-containing protein n=1 Tax=Daejeonella sp. TaxID=2805397 RepID=UPI0037C137E1